MEGLASYPFASHAALASASAFDPLRPTASATPAVLQRLAELPQRSHLHSSRTRRACVAIILRMQHPDDPRWMPLAPPRPKQPKAQRKQKKHAAAAASAEGPEAVENSAAQAQVQSPSSAPNVAATAAAASYSPVPAAPAPLSAAAAAAAEAADTMTRVESLIPRAEALSIHARVRSLSEEPWVRGSSLEVLYMQRAQNASDRWSGQMSFPGGRAAKGESDEATVVREVHEEIGWDLSDRARFLRLGQLDDKAMDGLKNVKPLAVAVFVYLHLGRSSEAPPLRLQPEEVAAVLFTPLSFLAGLRHPQQFGKIYHPLMLQVLQRRTPPPSHATGGAAGAPSFPAPPAAAPKVFELRLINYPHKREGRLLKEEAAELLGDEQAGDLQRIEREGGGDGAAEDGDDSATPAPGAPPLPATLQKLRARLRALAHELPLPLQTLPRTRLSLPPLLPALEQLASLRFPALSLPGHWTDARGRGGVSTQDDIRTVVTDLLPVDAAAAALLALPAGAAASSTPPPFILWGLTLERSCDLLLFLGHPFPSDFFARGSERRRRLYAWWANAGEARWMVERRVDKLRARREAASAAGAATGSQEPSATAATGPDGAPLVATPFSSPLLLSRAREALQPLRERAREAWQRQRQRALQLRSRL